MDLYGTKSSSTGQKILIVSIELVLLFVSYKILFGQWDTIFYRCLGLSSPTGDHVRNVVNFTFSCIVFLRLTFMMFFLMERTIPMAEALGVGSAFALYYVGYALLTVNTIIPLGAVDYLGIFFFVTGSFINTFSEVQRHRWKQQPEHQGKIYTEGLFRYAMHINYFGDVLWVMGYAILSRNPWSCLVPLWLFGFFVFYNIPKLDNYLKEKYGGQFIQYRERTKKIIPFVY